MVRDREHFEFTSQFEGAGRFGVAILSADHQPRARGCRSESRDQCSGRADQEIGTGHTGGSLGDPPKLGDYPFEWPSASREEAIELFESRAV